MVKIFAIIGLALMLGACGPGTIKLRTEVQQVYVPLLYCPAPPDILRPTLAIHDLVDEDANDPGKVVMYYKATVQQLEGYISELEAIVKQYDQTNAAYEELRDKFEDQWKDEFKGKTQDEATSRTN